MDRYARVRANREKRVRIVICLPKSELESVDNWGCSAGMPNRNAALRTLLRNALKTVVQTGGGTNAAVVRNRKKAR
jgi:metal-responsive CopG/Arc/MetJ family transcriptional regulator